MHRKGPRAELHHYVRIIKAAGWEVQARVQAMTVQPLGVEDPALSSTRCLNPAQGFRAAAPVVGGEQEIPDSQYRYRPDYVDNENVPHNAFSDADGTSEVAKSSRGQRLLMKTFFAKRSACCGKQR